MVYNYNYDFTSAFSGPAMEAASEALLSFAYGGVLGLLVLAAIFGVMVVFSAIKEQAQTRRFQAEDEVIECLGLEDISAQQYIDLGLDQDDGELQVDTTPIFEIHDNVVYLDEAYVPAQDTTVMEQDGVTLKENLEMAVWSCRRGFRSMVKFVKDLANAPARIRELEKELAELKKQQFDFDYYSEEEDEEVVTWVNKA